MVRDVASYLATGGAGFIGSHLAAALVGSGHAVRVVDNLTTGLIDIVPSTAEFIKGNPTDPAVADAAIGGCEVVLQQSAVPSVPSKAGRRGLLPTLQQALRARNGRNSVSTCSVQVSGSRCPTPVCCRCS